MRILVTGAFGFLGWHTRARLLATSEHEIISVGRGNWDQLSRLVRSADAIIHTAGVNRGPEDVVRTGNIQLARDLATAIAGSPKGRTVVYSNSIHETSSTAYGVGKRDAGLILQSAVSETGGQFANIVLPNLFGEHGRPGYNSFVATFAHKIVRGQVPIVEDRDVELLHAQQAAQALIDGLEGRYAPGRPVGTKTTVRRVLELLKTQYAQYSQGDVPELPDTFHADVFNTLRAAMFPSHFPIRLVRNSDQRGHLVEVVRAHGSEGQTFFSTSAPGVTRGQHFHLRKFERFVVVAGRARITLRRVLSEESVTFDVTGEVPVIVDMPTLWAHKVENTGASDLLTLFWTSELFDPNNTDTFSAEV